MSIALILFVIAPIILLIGASSNWGVDIVDGVRNGSSKDWLRWILIFLNSTMFVWIPLTCYKIHKALAASWKLKQNQEDQDAEAPYHLGFWFFPDILYILGPILAFLYLIVMPFSSFAINTTMKQGNLDIGLIIFAVWVLIHYLFFGIFPGSPAKDTSDDILLNR